MVTAISINGEEGDIHDIELDSFLLSLLYILNGIEQTEFNVASEVRFLENISFQS